jgi:nucleoside-diphosphate-sugar epimerase
LLAGRVIHMTSTVLVAGGAGFIGGHLCEALLRRGDYVICLDNLITGSEENLRALRDNDRFRSIQADVQETPEVACDVVFHLASPASPRHYQRWPIETMLANSNGTRRLAQVALASGAKFVLASTSEVYGDPLEHPQKETYWGNVNPVGPRACYDESKRFAEALSLEYHRQHNLDVRIARIFNTYGPGMALDDGRAVPAFICAALEGSPLPLQGDGSQTRSFCYVTDTVAALLAIADAEGQSGQVFNVGNSLEITIRELAERICNEVGVPYVVHPGEGAIDDPQRRCPDTSKIFDLLGWAPKVILDDGLRNSVSDFKSRLGARAEAS